MNSRFVLILILSWAICGKLIGQDYTNHWLQFDQPYVKLSVQEKGIQRVSLDSLNKAGLPTANPSKFQLFHRGKQVRILGIENRHLLFYGETNDGSLDSVLYRPMNSRTNPYFSYYTDLGSYILTVSKNDVSTSVIVNLPIDPLVNSEKYHINNQLFLANSAKSDYSNGVWQLFEPTPAQSFFSNGETMTGPAIIGDEEKKYTFSLKNRIQGSDVPIPTLELMLNGRNNIGFSIDLKIGTRSSNRITFSGFTGVKSKMDLNPTTDLDASDSGEFSLKSNNSTISSRYSLTYYLLKYAQSFDMLNQTSAFFNLPSSAQTTSKITIKNAPQNAVILDVSDPYNTVNLTGYTTANGLEVMVPRTSGKETKLYVASQNKSLKKIENVKYNKIAPENFDYIIITSAVLKESAQTYADYRKSDIGGGYKPFIIEINDVYNQFSYGEPHPTGIRNFINYVVGKGGDNKYLLLLGKHLAPARYLIKEIPDEIPSVGFPGSDILLISGLQNSHPDVEVIPVGRISASSNEQVINYLDKVKEFEASTITDQKKVLHLNGGKSSSEITQFKDLLASLTPLVQDAGGDVQAFVKQSNIEVEPVVIAPEVNSGVGMISYFGHGSPTVTDLDFGYASRAERGYSNKGKYPLMYFNGCGVGNIFNSYANPLSTDWVLTKDKGAIGVIANSHLSYYSSSADYITDLYKEIFSPTSSTPQTIGYIHKNVAKNITQKISINAYELSNLHQALLQGDPALKITFSNLPDYTIQGSGIYLQSKNDVTPIGNSDSLTVKVILTNLGKVEVSERITVQLERGYKGNNTPVENHIEKVITSYKDSVFFKIPNSGVLDKIKVTLDPDGLIKELNKQNNISELRIDWQEVSELTNYPEKEIIDLISPTLSITFNKKTLYNQSVISPTSLVEITLNDNSTLTTTQARIQVYLRNCWEESCQFQEIIVDNGIRDSGSNSITYSSLLNNLKEGNYELLVRAWDNHDNVTLIPFRIQFVVAESEDRLTGLIVSPNPATDFVRFQSSLESSDMKEIKMHILIYDIHGRQMAEETSSYLSGTNNWYWNPKSSGIFIYKIRYEWESGTIREVSGKLSVIK
jgi:hypothetical protein